MKKVIWLLLLTPFFVNAYGQKVKEENVPVAVRDVFSQSYPDIKKVYWGKDSIYYMAAFHTGKAPCTVTYDTTGKRVITEMQTPVEDLPKAIVEYVQKNYPGEIFVEAAQITDAAGVITYEVQVKDLDLIFDANGNFKEALKCYH